MTRRSRGALAALATAGVLAGCGGSGGGSPRAITFEVTVPAGTAGTTVAADEVVTWRDWCELARGPAVRPAAR